VWTLVGVCGCYAPTPQEGLPCSDDGNCPAGQQCIPGIELCYGPSSADGPGGPADASPAVGPDGALVSPDGCPEALAIVPSNFSRCDIPSPQGPLVLGPGSWTIDTSNGTISEEVGGPIEAATAVYAQAAGPELMVVAASSITIEASCQVRVVGARALVLVSTGDLGIAGSIDASAELSTPGPGGNHAGACASGSGPAGATMTFPTQGQGGGGGGGGGFRDVGGTGGIVQLSAGAGSPGGAISGSAELTPLRGGCAGGTGGTRTDDTFAGGTGGGGGGALQLVAGGAISISGTINAGGGGGLRASVNGGTTGAIITSLGRGGGGGGSGGAILLEAIVIDNAGAITANGGGGGEGQYSGYTPDANGSNAISASATPAPGGDADNSGATVYGGPGGAGGAGVVAAQSGRQGLSYNVNNYGYGAGGGGGGGSSGRIRINGTLVDNGLISPPPSVN